MNKLFIPLILGAFVLTACSQVATAPTIETVDPVVETVKDEVVELDATTNTYNNYEYAYSINIPKTSAGWDCNDEREDVEVIVIKEGAKSYITPKYDNACKKGEIFKIPDFDSWIIVSKPVSNEDELSEFINDQYALDGGDCKVTSVGADGKVEIETTDPDGGCFINYITAPYYDKANGFAHKFDLGQDAKFYAGGNDVYDINMAQSFKLLN